jgi:glycosyltransferase involved in cell wall biosynthesis
MPRVSVILTVFERECFLRRAIESALEQTFTDFEIIVTDDSNKSAIRRICESFQCGDRLRYRSNARRIGAPLNLRNAICEARGNFVSILNDDDFWGPTFLEKLVVPLEENSNRVIAFSDHWIVRVNGEVDDITTETNTLLYARQKLPRGEIQDPAGLILHNNGLPLAMASLFRKDCLDVSLLTDNIVGAYDFWISCILAASGKSFFYVPERLTYYRVHGASETARRAWDKSQPVIFIYRELLRENWFPQMKELIKAKLSQAYFCGGKDSLLFGKRPEARSLFLRSIETKFHYKPVIGLALTLFPRILSQKIWPVARQ